MRKTLLIASMLCITVAGWAQSSYSDALEAQVGKNAYTVEGTEADSVFWKYTPEKNCLALVGPQDGSYTLTTATVIRANAETSTNDTLTLKAADENYPKKYFALKQGETYYFMQYVTGATELNLELKDCEDLSGGASQEAPVTIVPGTYQMVGDPYATGYTSSSYYASYTADKDGMLIISSFSYLGSASVNGTRVTSEYKQGVGYQIKTTVKSGETYAYTFFTSSPIVFSSEMTQPTAGSLDYPFEMTEGENTVPAAYGDYYYTYTPTKTGYMSIKSDNALPGGQVKIYSSKYSVSSGYYTAASEQGSYNVRTEVPYAGYYTYYICVSKIDATAADETFTFAMEDYQQGETESNPLPIDTVPSTITLPAAQGTFYYGMTVPANTSKFLKVTATSETVSSGTSVKIYADGNSYGGASGTKSASFDVTSANDQVITIKWTASETEPLTFNVSYEDITKGDVITNPETAVLGENTISGSGTKYYTYTPTKNCKLSVSGTPDMTLSFPTGTSKWDGNYETFVNGIEYSIEATEGVAYLIKLEGCADKDVFTVAENEFKQGEVQSNPIVVEDSVYDINSSNASNLWLKYVAKNDGVVTVYCDVPYSYLNTVEYGKYTDGYYTGMVSSEQQGGDYISVYKGSKIVKKDDAIIVHLAIKAFGTDSEGKELPATVKFTERGFEAGEDITTPIILALGDTVTITNPSYDSPVWVKASLNKGTSIFNCDQYLGGVAFNGLDNATLGESYGTSFSMNSAQDENTGSYYFTFEQTTEEAGEYYFMIRQGYGSAKLTLAKNGDVVDGISEMTVSTTGKGVKVYNLNGTLVGENISGLKAGMYIISENGKSTKVVIK